MPCGSQPGKIIWYVESAQIRLPALRPILSMLYTVEYKLAKYLDTFIKPCIPSDFMLGSTNEFLQALDEAKLNPTKEYHMISYDVVSLFTNIPLSETIDLAVRYVYSENSQKKPAFSESIFKFF